MGLTGPVKQGPVKEIENGEAEKANGEREEKKRRSESDLISAIDEEEKERGGTTMGVMEKLKIFTVKEPIVVASCLIAGFGLLLPAVVRPALDSFQRAEQVPPPALSDVVAGVTGKKK